MKKLAFREDLNVYICRMKKRVGNSCFAFSALLAILFSMFAPSIVQAEQLEDAKSLISFTRNTTEDQVQKQRLFISEVEINSEENEEEVEDADSDDFLDLVLFAHSYAVWQVSNELLQTTKLDISSNVSFDYQVPLFIRFQNFRL